VLSSLKPGGCFIAVVHLHALVQLATEARSLSIGFGSATMLSAPFRTAGLAQLPCSAGQRSMPGSRPAGSGCPACFASLLPCSFPSQHLQASAQSHHRYLVWTDCHGICWSVAFTFPTGLSNLHFLCCDSPLLLHLLFSLHQKQALHVAGADHENRKG